MELRAGETAVGRDKTQIGDQACGSLVQMCGNGDAAGGSNEAVHLIKGNIGGADEQVFTLPVS